MTWGAHIETLVKTRLIFGKLNLWVNNTVYIKYTILYNGQRWKFQKNRIVINVLATYFSFYIRPQFNVTLYDGNSLHMSSTLTMRYILWFYSSNFISTLINHDKYYMPTICKSYRSLLRDENCAHLIMYITISKWSIKWSNRYWRLLYLLWNKPDKLAF